MPLRAFAVPLAAAMVGGGITAGVLVGAGATGGSRSTTIVEQSPLASSSPVAAGRGGLTARDIYKRAGPGVVFIRARSVQEAQSPFDVFPRREENVSTGSGFVLDERGDILTNAHVVASSLEVKVTFSDHRTVAARVRGKDPDTDLAVLRVDPEGLELKPLELGDSRSVQVGDPTVAIGNPFGLERTLTTGVVSALQRRITAPSGFAIEDVIQTDAAINPGNSGGPLLDAAGRVIGINSQIATGDGTSGNVGIAFAVPVNTAKRVLPQLERSGRVRRAFLGLRGRPASGGVLVELVQAGSPAAEAGIEAGDREAIDERDGSVMLLGGDVLARLGDRAVKTLDDVHSALQRHKPGDEVTVEVIREGRRQALKVRLGERPGATAAE